MALTSGRRARCLGVLVLVSLVTAGCIVSTEQDPVVSQEQDATETYWTCTGTTGKHVPADGHFYATCFGCWIDEHGNHRGDPSDNCIPWCQGGDPAGYAEVCAGLSGPACERQIHWYAAGADRYGCFTRIRATNPHNGKSVVLLVIDKGPACWIEDQVDHWVADISYPASYYLFGEPKNAPERADLIIQVVSDTTPLGPDDTPVPFIGDGCEMDEECSFSADGQPGQCAWHGAEHVGFCTMPCEGYCPDQAGKATTFCVSLDGGYSGNCVSKAGPLNDQCNNVPGLVSRELPRFTGASSAPAATATVCVPDWVQ